MNDTTTNLGEVTITRIFEAPPHLIFECMTTPEHLTHFWGPIGVHTPIETIKVDAKPGGVFDTVMVNDSDGVEFKSHAIFAEVDPPNRLVWIEPDVEGGMTTSVTFTDLGDGRTEVTIFQTNVPEMYRSAEAQAGMQTSLDRFAAYLGSL